MLIFLLFFFFNDTATTEIYTLSLHDALPILRFALLRVPTASGGTVPLSVVADVKVGEGPSVVNRLKDRKSTRLNSSHANISYAVFCLKKKKKHRTKPLLCQTDDNKVQLPSNH